MSETPHTGNSDVPIGEPRHQFDQLTDEALRAQSQAAELRAAQKTWLEAYGVDPETVPHLTMRSSEELHMFRNAPRNYQGQVRSIYGIPQVEQGAPQFALVDVLADDPNTPAQPRLLDLDEADFGTAIDIAEDMQLPQAQPTNPDAMQHTQKPVAVDDKLAELSANWEGVHEDQAVQEAWLELHGIDLEEIPRINFRSQQEFEVFRSAPANYQRYVKGLYHKKPEAKQDQINPQFALITVPSDGPDSPPSAKLMVINEVDFGTTFDRERLEGELRMAADLDPDNPNRPADAYHTVNIGETIQDVASDLSRIATRLMDGRTTDPFYAFYGDIGVRAGEPWEGQQDAYVWKNRGFSLSVALTLAFPSQYNSVCVVRGTERPPANDKPNMAQIEHPETVLKIEGEQLEALQDVYRKLYTEPDYALTETQREDRDTTFNSYFERLISAAAHTNRDEESRRRSSQPQVRYLDRPR